MEDLSSCPCPYSSDKGLQGQFREIDKRRALKRKGFGIKNRERRQQKMEENKTKVFQGTGCSKQCHSGRHGH
jgi:hypothetical protein